MASRHATDADLNAQQAADPLSTTAGELHSPARMQLPIIASDLMRGAPRRDDPGSLRRGPDENNAWFEDSTVSFIILKAFEPGSGRTASSPAGPPSEATGRKRGAYLFGHPSNSASLAASTFCTILKNNGFQLSTGPGWTTR